MAQAEAGGVRWPWRSTAAILLFNCALVAWLLLKLGSHGVFTAVDNVAQGLGPLLVAPLCIFGGGGLLRRGDAALGGAGRWQRWAPILLGLSALCQFGGQAIYTIYQQVLHYQLVPFPAWSDAVYLCEYPFLFLGILLLPGRRLDLTSRTRVLLDGLMIMTAAITFSWYFILGPTFLAASASSFATAVGSAYPTCDMVLIACLLLLSGRQVDPAMRRVVALLAVALVVIVTTDSIYDYQQLNSGYATGELLDLGWPLGYMLVGLAGRAWLLVLAHVPVAPRQERARPTDDNSDAALPPRLWRALLPYALIPPVGVLLISTLHAHGDQRLQDGVFVGSAILIGLVLLRQVMALRENNRLYGRLHRAYGQLEERNRETVAYAHNLERLNAELRDMHTNNRALSMANEQLEVMATTDALTGLPNRTLLHDRVQQALVVAQREHTSVALLLMDLDRFKEVNDTLGHRYGDLLLQQAGLRMQQALRSSDTVARLGGDEFAVLLPGSDIAAALHVARLILETFEAQIVIEGQAFDVDMSIGIAAYPDHGADPTELLRQADVAMYVAKRSHSGYAVYDAAHDHNNSVRIGLMSELRQALAADQLDLFYQPLVDMGRGELVGAEALLRWPHPEHGFIAPDQFIPLAEHTGVIAPLTQWVLERALQQCRAWRASGLELGVQVNLSMRVLHDLQVPETVTDLLQRHDIAPEWLTLEITESALMVDPGRALDVLTRLSALGVRIAIDDFGTGYSSLGYLKRLPVDEVKIDKSFVLGMDQDAKDSTIVRSVIALAHAMGLAVVAEGIETGDALALLRSLSCDVAQGYYFSRPLPQDEFTRWASAFAHSDQRASA